MNPRGNFFEEQFDRVSNLVWNLQKNPPSTWAGWLGRFLGLFTGVRVDLAERVRSILEIRHEDPLGAGVEQREVKWKKHMYFIIEIDMYYRCLCKKGFMVFQWISLVSVCSTGLCIAALHLSHWDNWEAQVPLEVFQIKISFIIQVGWKYIEDGKQMRSESSLKQDSLSWGKTQINKSMISHISDQSHPVRYPSR